MAFAPSASWNSRSITHLANYPSPSLPMISSDEPSRLLLADNPQASSLVARPRVDSHSGAGEAGRNPNDRRLDSHRRPTLVDSAALHAAFFRHQAAHRKTQTGVAEPAASATHGAKRE